MASNSNSADAPLESVATDQPLLALTFDDGPQVEATTEVLDILQQAGVVGTFFLVGERVAECPEIARRIQAEGHEIGNHSYSHANLPQLESAQAIEAEIARTQVVIQQVVGVEPRLFRAPFLAHDARVHQALERLQLSSINASCSSKDWQPGQTREQIYHKVTSEVQAGGIVLMHDWPVGTRQALSEIIHQLQSRGFRLVTVSDLIAAGEPPR